MADELRGRFAIDQDVVDVVALADGLGCKVSMPNQISKTRAVEADLRPFQSQDRFHVQVDPTPRRGWAETPASDRDVVARRRFRFRVCHELGHTFFFKRKPGSGPKRLCPWNASEEEWCDEFARALLIPHHAATQSPSTADSPFDLQGKFDVSLEVAARAFAATHPRAEVALWFWRAREDVVPSSLLRQWASVSGAPSLRRWREGGLVATALADGYAQGSLPDLRRGRRRLAATARRDETRRQVVAIAQR
jgi:IrrE N-terminal-like domain